MIDNTLKIVAAIERASMRAFTRLGYEIVADVKRSMKSGGPGKPGRRPHAKPGSPPNVQYGILRASIDHEVVKGSLGNAISARVGTNLGYGRDLELAIGVAPHPFLKPAIQNKSKRAQELLAEELLKEVGR
ncbi:MAG: hypothetical protein ABFC80_04085 [Coriobacteriales bacterium]